MLYPLVLLGPAALGYPFAIIVTASIGVVAGYVVGRVVRARGGAPQRRADGKRTEVRDAAAVYAGMVAVGAVILVLVSPIVATWSFFAGVLVIAAVLALPPALLVLRTWIHWPGADDHAPDVAEVWPEFWRS